MSSKEMRGLTIFITDLRAATTKEKERARIVKELTHIRDKFTNTKDLSDYDRKKYIWKLVYIYLQGYDVDFGHMVAIGMINSKNFSVKQAGYFACSVLLAENVELMRLTIQSIKSDIALNAPDTTQSLALAFAANSATAEVGESIWDDVCRLLFHRSTKVMSRKKSALCLLRIIRRNPEVIPMDAKFANAISLLLADSNVGVLIATSSLVLGVVAQTSMNTDPELSVEKLYPDVPNRCIGILSKICFNSSTSRSVYKYYNTICPWLQVKLLKILQYFPQPSSPELQRVLTQLLSDILTKIVLTKNANKNNADYSIFFEAVHLVFHLSRRHPHPSLDNAASAVLRFVSIKEPNFRYVALDAMTKLATLPHALSAIRKQKNVIMASIRDPDISIRKRALDLLYSSCDVESVKMIVQELLSLLETETYGLREELVLKIVILAEQYAPELHWYVDVVLRLIEIAGAFVSDDVWFRIVQVTTNAEELQEYAVQRALQALAHNNLHENGVKLCGYLLGEFSYRLSDETIDAKSMLQLLLHHYKNASYATRSVLLTAFCKMGNTFPDIKEEVLDIFRRAGACIDSEVQQRASEYLHLAALDEDLVATVLDVMPEWPERNNGLLKLLRHAYHSSADRDIWATAADKVDAEILGETADIDHDAKVVQQQAQAQSQAQSQAQAAAAHAHQDSDSDSDSDIASANQSPRGNKSTDLFSDDLFGSIANQSTQGQGTNGGNKPYPPQDQSLVISTLRGTSPNSIIYKSRELEIQCRTQLDLTAGHSIKMVLLITNTSQYVMKNIKVQMSESTNTSQNVRSQIKVTSTNGILNSQATEKIFILTSVTRPFQESPSLSLQFTWDGDNDTSAASSPTAAVSPTDDIFGFLNSGLDSKPIGGSNTTMSTPRELIVQLPVVTLSFCKQNEMSGQDFTELWNTTVITTPAQYFTTSNSQNLWNIQTLKEQFTERWKLSNCIVPGTSAQTMHFVGTFTSIAKNVSGQFVTMPVIIKVDFGVDGTTKLGFNVTAGHATVAQAIIASIKAVF